MKLGTYASSLIMFYNANDFENIDNTTVSTEQH